MRDEVYYILRRGGTGLAELTGVWVASDYLVRPDGWRLPSAVMGILASAAGIGHWVEVRSPERARRLFWASIVLAVAAAGWRVAFG